MNNIKSYIKNNWPRMLIIFGMSIVIFTILFGLYSKAEQRRLIGSYETVVKEHLDLTNTDLDKAYEYNDALTDIQVGSTKDETLETTNEYKSIFKNNNGMIGILNIQKIGLKLPIYHGTEEETLNKGVGHFEQSSFPLDNYGSRSILTGHNGLPGADMLFTRLDEMEINDKFYVTIGQWNYHFKVKEIKPYMTPEDADDFARSNSSVDNPAEVVLITCTPYGINTHRFVVIGEFRRRTLTATDDPTETTLKFSLGKEMIAMIIILIMSIVSLIISYIRSKGRKDE